MHMPGHSHKGMNGNPVFGGGILKKGQIGLFIRLIVKAGLPFIATLNDMPGTIGQIKS